MALDCQHTALRAEQIGCDERAIGIVRLSCWVVLALPARGRRSGFSCGPDVLLLSIRPTRREDSGDCNCQESSTTTHIC